MLTRECVGASWSKGNAPESPSHSGCSDGETESFRTVTSQGKKERGRFVDEERKKEKKKDRNDLKKMMELLNVKRPEKPPQPAEPKELDYET